MPKYLIEYKMVHQEILEAPNTQTAGKVAHEHVQRRGGILLRVIDTTHDDLKPKEQRSA